MKKRSSKMIKELSKWAGLQMPELMTFRIFMGNLFEIKKGNVLKMSKKVQVILGHHSNTITKTPCDNYLKDPQC